MILINQKRAKFKFIFGTKYSRAMESIKMMKLVG